VRATEQREKAHEKEGVRVRVRQCARKRLHEGERKREQDSRCEKTKCRFLLKTSPAKIRLRFIRDLAYYISLKSMPMGPMI